MSYTLRNAKPCPFCGSSYPQVEREGNGRQSAQVSCDDCGCWLESNENGAGKAWNTRALDEASYRAGIEAAIIWFTSKDASTGDHMVDLHYRELADELRALPTPSTLPQEGGELSKGETE